MAQIPYPTGTKPLVKPVAKPVFPPLDAGLSMGQRQPTKAAPRVAPTANLVRPAGLPTPQPLMPKKISPLINQSVGTPPTLKPGGIPLPPPSGFIKGEKNYIDRAGEGYFKRFGTHFTPADVRTKEYPKGRVDPYGFSDAARHAGGASIMASDLGIIPTNIAGLMHELFISGNDVGGWMDLKNNFMGSLAGGLPRLANMLTGGGGASSFNVPGANSELITEEARMDILEYMIRNNWLSTLEENNNFQWFMNEAKNRNAMSGVAR